MGNTNCDGHYIEKERFFFFSVVHACVCARAHACAHTCIYSIKGNHISFSMTLHLLPRVSVSHWTQSYATSQQGPAILFPLTTQNCAGMQDHTLFYIHMLGIQAQVLLLMHQVLLSTETAL